jgi:hypothetical protein
MKKPYLLIAGDNYYPSAYTGDWRGCYSSYTEAKEASEQYAIRDDMWYEIIDLRGWTE